MTPHRTATWSTSGTGPVRAQWAPREAVPGCTCAPVDDVTLSFSMRVSDDWAWTGVPFHPHMFHFLTNADWEYVGPAFTFLTTYTEVVNGIPRLALQDGRNVDTSHVREDITRVTEARAIAGCNGDADGHGVGDCYQAGDSWANGKAWTADRVYLSADVWRWQPGRLARDPLTLPDQHGE